MSPVRIYQAIEEFKGVKFAVASVGTFDGVHLGHQMIIRRMKEVAEAKGGETVIVTFDPHPRRVIYSDSADMKLINSARLKKELLEKNGIGHLIILPFTAELSRLTSGEFIEQFLVNRIHAGMVVVGYNHHFGKGREGDFRSLEAFGDKYGFQVEEVPPQVIDGVTVSSTKIRKALIEGNVTLANKMLGHEYSLTGRVIDGVKLGSRMGFPTANIVMEDKKQIIAGDGVYACRVRWRKREFLGMGSIGTRPTFDGHNLAIEVHIFDFHHKIYGEELTIYWVERIRDEIKFNDINGLRDQLISDRTTVLRIFGRET
jgi:riboflavin kinase/FMN adenylyltransferase